MRLQFRCYIRTPVESMTESNSEVRYPIPSQIGLPNCRLIEGTRVSANKHNPSLRTRSSLSAHLVFTVAAPTKSLLFGVPWTVLRIAVNDFLPNTTFFSATPSLSRQFLHPLCTSVCFFMRAQRTVLLDAPRRNRHRDRTLGSAPTFYLSRAYRTKIAAKKKLPFVNFTRHPDSFYHGRSAGIIYQKVTY